MATGLVSATYGSDSDDASSEENKKPLKSLGEDECLHLKPLLSKKQTKVDLKPDINAPIESVINKQIVVYTKGEDSVAASIGSAGGSSNKVLLYNPTAEQLFAPKAGPKNPFKSEFHDNEKRNTLGGFVEPAYISDFQFDMQRKTFHSYGYAADPSDVSDGKIVGDTTAFAKAKGRSVFHSGPAPPGEPKTAATTSGGTEANETVPEDKGVLDLPRGKRKRDKNFDPGDVEGYLGPWAKYKDEKTIARPAGDDVKFCEEYVEKVRKNSKRYRRRRDDTKDTQGPQLDTDNLASDKHEESTVLHIDDPYDYQGRPFLHGPHDVGVNLRSEFPPERCYLPKKLVHTWRGHSKGVNAIRWFPQTAHLILSASADSKLKIWEVYHGRRCVRTYLGHKNSVRDACFANDGKSFLSASYDRYIKLWDTETGQVVSRFTKRKVPYCVKFNPDIDKQNLFIAGCQDKKIYCWDVRTGNVVQEYDRHLGPVNSITFIDHNRRFASTSDDRSIRIWEWNIPVDFKYIADPTMHAISAACASPNGKWLTCQSMDNQIQIYNVYSHFKLMKKKTFNGHMVSSYAIQPDYSPDMSFLVSGDGDGKVFVWDFKSTKCFSKWAAHDDACINTIWHPHETSKLATCSWDNTIKFWD